MMMMMKVRDSNAEADEMGIVGWMDGPNGWGGFVRCMLWHLLFYLSMRLLDMLDDELYTPSLSVHAIFLCLGLGR